jgi:hypothetical protein
VSGERLAQVDRRGGAQQLQVVAYVTECRSTMSLAVGLDKRAPARLDLETGRLVRRRERKMLDKILDVTFVGRLSISESEPHGLPLQAAKPFTPTRLPSIPLADVVEAAGVIPRMPHPERPPSAVKQPLPSQLSATERSEIRQRSIRHLFGAAPIAAASDRNFLHRTQLS